VPQYTLLLRDESADAFARLSPAEIQTIVSRYQSWAAALGAAGKLAGSHKLRNEQGRVMRKNGSKVIVTDGPFTEGKEVMAGLFVVEAATYDEAVEIANGCPHLDFGSIEVREIEIMRRA
jgi:hypothetical protein